MAFSLSPSVEFQEIDLTGVVPAVATAIGAYAGSFEWGPCLIPVTISNEKNLSSLFGKPRIVSSISSFNNQNDWYSVANYLAYSSNIKVVRGVSADHKNSSEYRTLVGKYKTKAEFVPAQLDSLPIGSNPYVTYTVDFSNGSVSGTNAEGEFQVIELIAAPGPTPGGSSGAGVAGSRKRRKIVTTIPSSPISEAAVAQQEKITFEGTVSTTGYIYVQFGTLNTLQIQVLSGSSTSSVASLVSAAINGASPVVASLSTANINQVSLTRATAGSSVSESTGINSSTGRVRSVSVTTSIPGLSAIVEVTKIGTNANTAPIFIAQDGQNASNKSFILLEQNDTAQTLSLKLSNALKDLSFVYGGVDAPVSLISNNIEWTNAIIGSTPSSDITAIAGENFNTAAAITDLAFAITEVSAGSDYVAPSVWTFRVQTNNLFSPSLPIVSASIPGGSSNTKFIALVKDAIESAGGIKYDSNSYWTVEVSAADPSRLKFTAPVRTVNAPTLTLSVLDGSLVSQPVNNINFVITSPTVVQGANPNSATITVNGVAINAQEGDNGSALAEEWKYNVENALVPSQVFNSLPQNSTDGAGAGALFNVTITPSETYSVALVSGQYGDDYTVGEVLTINGTEIGGFSPENDLEITINGIGSNSLINNEPTIVVSSVGGTGATVDITPTGLTYNISANADGSGYLVGDTVKVLGTTAGIDGATPLNDLQLTVSSVGNNELFSAVAITSTTSVDGVGATFNITRNPIGFVGDYQVTSIANGGSGFLPSESITIDGSDIGGVTGLNDLIFTVATVNSAKTFNNLTQLSTTGSGSGATFIVQSEAGLFTEASIDTGNGNGGDGYAVGDDVVFAAVGVEGLTDATFNVATVDTSKLYDTNALALVGVTSGGGSGAEFTFQRSGGTYSTAAIVTGMGGTGYAPTDTITYDGSDLDGVTVTNDAVITVLTVGVGGAILTVSIAAGTAVQTGAILTLDTPTGTASSTGSIVTTTIVSGVADETGPVTGYSFTVPPVLITSGSITPGAISISGTPASYKPVILIDNAEPWKLEVRCVGNEGIAPMVGGSNIPQDFIAYGMAIKTSPKIITAAEYSVTDHLIFETDGDVTNYINEQLGDFNTMGYVPKVVSIDSGSTTASGPATSWEYNSVSGKTEIVIEHGAGVNFKVGIPTPAEDALQEPTETVAGSLVYVKTNELIKNDEHFSLISEALDGGFFYGIYPGAKGNAFGVGIIDATVSSSVYKAATFADGIRFDNIFDSRPGTSDYANSIGSGFNDELHVVVFDNDGSITGTKGAILEKYSFLSKNRKAKDGNGTNSYYVEAINSSSDYIRVIEGFVGYGDVKVDLTADLRWGNEPVTQAGQYYGVMNTGLSVNLRGGADVMLQDADAMAAWDILSDSEKVDISLVLTGNNSKLIKKYVQSIVDSRRDAVCFISPDYQSAVASADEADINEYFNSDVDGFNSSSYAVFDSGFKYQYDRYNNVYFWAPLSSDIAGLCARTDQTNDSWWSPAGETRGQIKNVVRLSYNPDKTARDNLYKNRINPVVTQTGRGTYLLGDKTALSKPSAFDRINVRRLFITLEKAISTFSRGYLFEFNDIFTRASFVQKVEPYLRNIQARRGVEEFAVVCDTTNNTPQVINSDSFVGDIYIKPPRSINFISLNFVAVNSGVSFEEVINPSAA